MGWQEACAAVAALGLCVSSGTGDLIIDSGTGETLDVDYYVGDGANTSYMIVDFSVTGGGCYAFGYRWNTGLEPTYAFEMHIAVSSVMGGLVWEWDTAGEFGAFTINFEYEGDVGDPDNFWAYWTAEPADIDPGVDWNFSNVGVSLRPLVDGSLDGWINTFEPGAEPCVPTVPGPGGLALLTAPLLLRRRRRR